jgi:hypothetical protein
MRLYFRRVIARFTGSGGELKVTDLKIAFDVTKTVSSSQNTATIKIWNLKSENRHKVKKEFDRVRLEAGYQGSPGAKGNVGVIFDGHIRDVTHERDQVDIITSIECGDGDKASRKGVISKSFPKDTTPKQMIEEILKHMPDVERGEWKGIDDLPAYKRPVVMCGSCTRELDKIGRTHKRFWSVQDGALEVIPHDGYFDDVVVISPETGMVGVPSPTDNGVKVDCLLNPQLRCNRLIEVRSETLDMNEKSGRYRISGLSFSGDNRDGDFIASIHGEKVDDGRVPEVESDKADA